MTKYFCDLCGKECKSYVFEIPFAATWIGDEPCDLVPVEVHLCKKCRTKIYRTIEQLTPKDKIRQMNTHALDIKMGKVIK